MDFVAIVVGMVTPDQKVQGLNPDAKLISKGYGEPLKGINLNHSASSFKPTLSNIFLLHNVLFYVRYSFNVEDSSFPFLCIKQGIYYFVY